MNKDWANAIIPQLINSQSSCHKKVAEKANLLFDFRFVEHEDYEEQQEDFETLKQALPNHIISIFAAFGGLRSLPADCKNKIIEGFAKEVIKEPTKEVVETKNGKMVEKYVSLGQGWEVFQKVVRGEKKLITNEELLSTIKDRITLSDSRYYYPKSEEGEVIAAIGASISQKSTSENSRRTAGGR